MHIQWIWKYYSHAINTLLILNIIPKCRYHRYLVVGISNTDVGIGILNYRGIGIPTQH